MAEEEKNNETEEGIKVIDKRRFVLKEDGSVEKREDREKVSYESKKEENKVKPDEGEIPRREVKEKEYGRIPPADFKTFISTLATNALIHLGHLPEPSTGQQVKNLDVARYHIDVIDMLKEKTKGNLTPEEERFIEDILHDLKLRFVEESKKIQ